MFEIDILIDDEFYRKCYFSVKDDAVALRDHYKTNPRVSFMETGWTCSDDLEETIVDIDSELNTGY